jgi:peptidoglycan hydrolase-like protein with peptidoglycan-binding domain
MNKSFLVVLGAIVIILFVGAFSPKVSAQTTDISSLLKIIQQLTQQLNQLQIQVNAFLKSKSSVGTQASESGQVNLGELSGRPISCLVGESNQGDKEDSLYLVQAVLNKGGYYSEGFITGYFGDLTRAAIIAFQKGNGLAQTGIVDSSTAVALNSLVQKYYPQCGPTTTPSTIIPGPVVGGITVMSPLVGDVWHLGQTYKILWNSGISSDVKVQITLASPRLACLDANPPCMTTQSLVAQVAPYTIIASTENDGSYDWTVPANLASIYIGNQQITIKTIGGATFGRSGTFIIDNTLVQSGLSTISNSSSESTVNSSGDQNSIIPAPAAFSVISPSSGERWIVGQAYNIEWTGYDSKKPVVPGKISIYFSPISSCLGSTQAMCSTLQISPYVIAQNVPDSGNYQWTIPKDFPSAYIKQGQITIVDSSSGKSAVSSSFYIVASAYSN